MVVWYGDDIRKQLPKTLSEKDIEESVALTKKLGDRLAKRPPTKVGVFSYRISTNKIHPGNPIQLEIQDTQNNRIATFGFYVQSEGGEAKLVVNHVQGVRGKQEELGTLSRQVGENWRVWLVKRIKRVAATSKVRIAGSLPPLFFLIGAGASPQAYKRYVRQYKQTFRKAGITDIQTHKISPYGQKDRDFWRELKAKETQADWCKRHHLK